MRLLRELLALWRASKTAELPRPDRLPIPHAPSGVTFGPSAGDDPCPYCGALRGHDPDCVLLRPIPPIPPKGTPQAQPGPGSGFTDGGI